ncbi:hypothetical protein L4D09_08060 [Photobacterium makurazakiensis]|uniref:hypothetical protein n=1 Tax=Photobacterium makurazakiensis TaxID=2910234 RepID=UPI003D0D625D
MSIDCKILELAYLNTRTLCLTLQATSDFKFLAGQYVMLELDKGQKLPFSIACAPTPNHEFEIHLGGITAQSELASHVGWLQQCFKKGESIRVDEPAGHAWLRPVSDKTVFIAGGSGYTYTRSLLQEALKHAPDSDITLYWGAYSEDDLYENDYLNELAASHTGFTYIPVTETKSVTQQIRQGKLLDIVNKECDFSTLPDTYICGRYEMVQTAFAELKNRHHQLSIYSDALPAE